MDSSVSVFSLLLCLLYQVTAQNDLCSINQAYEYFITGVLENTTVDSQIGHVDVTGTDDEISIQQRNHSYFFFDPNSRNIILIKELDTDQGSEEMDVLILDCYIRGEQDPIELTVRVIAVDYNDNPPVFNQVHHETYVPEDALKGTTVYSDTIAEDNDKAFDGNSRVTYSIVDGTEFSSYFEIETITKPDIVLAKQLDYENVTQMEIYIEAKDNPSPNRGEQKTATATLTVHVLDADDQHPEFSAKTYKGSIREDAPVGTIVTVVPEIVARDPDTMNVSVVYRILDPYDLFVINRTTAVMRNVKPLIVDVPTLTVVVLASQVDNPNREWFAMVTISITEANINAPRFSALSYEVTKTELEPVNSVLLTTTATDSDFKSVTGTVIVYDIVEDVSDLEIDEMGNIILLKPLDYEREREKNIRVTASDGSHTATASVRIVVLDVNDNKPQLIIEAVQFEARRERGYLVTTVTASDADVDDTVTFELRGSPHFAINDQGQITVNAEPAALTKDRYSVLVAAIDDGDPTPRETTSLVEVNFPALNPNTQSPPTSGSNPTTTTQSVAAAATVMKDDNMLMIVLGAVAGLLLVIVIVLIVYIIWRNRRTKEELDRAKAPPGHAAKGLTYRQAEAPDDLPTADLAYPADEDVYEISEGATTVQQNPLTDSGVNQGYLQSSGSEMDRDVSEIEIETAVVPYDDDFGFPPGRPGYGDRFRTFHGDDTTSNDSSHSDSTGGSQRVLVNGNKPGEAKITSWDSDDKIHPQGAQKLLDSKSNTATKKKERPEITVYF